MDLLGASLAASDVHPGRGCKERPRGEQERTGGKNGEDRAVRK